MAFDKVIDSAVLDANLTAVADAIRGKAGTTGELAFPGGFVSAVEGISGGGSMFASTASGRITEYEKGTAMSEFILDFETSAVGALQEG